MKRKAINPELEYKFMGNLQNPTKKLKISETSLRILKPKPKSPDSPKLNLRGFSFLVRKRETETNKKTGILKLGDLWGGREEQSQRERRSRADT